MLAMTRRALLAAGALLPFAPRRAAALVVAPEPEAERWVTLHGIGYNLLDPWELARFLCDWERSAIQYEAPMTWQRKRYTTIVRWNDEVLFFLVVGQPEYVMERESSLMKFLENETILGHHTHEDGRVFVVIVEATASDDLIDNVPLPAADMTRLPGVVAYSR